VAAPSARPTLAQVVTRYLTPCAEQFGLSASQRKVCRAIRACRTAALGGHLQACEDCGTSRYVYHSCRNRHCPKCQTQAKERWIDARVAELLPVPYFHRVFTLPHSLHRLLPQQARWMYDTLFGCASQTLLAFGRDPARLNGTLGITLVLHTWAQDEAQWRAFLDELRKPEWVVYAKPPFGGPEQVIAYLGRYTHRTAISEQRLIEVGDQRVRLRVRRGVDRSERKVVALPGADFLHRFVQHVLPTGFQRLRHSGLTASRGKKAKLGPVSSAVAGHGA